MEFEEEFKEFIDEYDLEDWTLNEFKTEIIGNFKDWRPKKELVKVPKFIAEFIEEEKKYRKNGVSLFVIFMLANEYETVDKKYKWIRQNADEFADAWVNGYEVEEKVYLLKHIDMSKNESSHDYYLAREVYQIGRLSHYGESKKIMPKEPRFMFKESELENLHIGSYEKIEVVND